MGALAVRRPGADQRQNVTVDLGKHGADVAVVKYIFGRGDGRLLAIASLNIASLPS
jgi:hypothetical protein